MMVEAAPTLSLAGNPARNSSFRLPMLLLPRRKSRDLLTLYAICRALDDAVDDAPDTDAASTALALWRTELETALQGGTPSQPLAVAFGELHQRYVFRHEDVEAMLEALAMDSAGTMVYPSALVLERYCYGVASCVGLLAMRIFGCEEASARPFATALGQALQRTNILRDVLEDAGRGRIYLPLEWVAEAGQPPSPAAVLSSPSGLLPVYAKLAESARDYFQLADALGRNLPPQSIAPALAMRDVYVCYWKKLEEQNWLPPTSGRLPLNWHEKSRLTLRGAGYMAGRFRPSGL